MLSINSELRLGKDEGITLRNRVVVPPMASETCDEQGVPTKATFDHYGRLSSSGAALVMVEYTYVHPYGRSEPYQMGLVTQDQLAGAAGVARIIKSSGAVSGIQLVFGGAKSSYKLTGGHLIGPSSVTVPVAGQALERPRAASLGDIGLIKEAFLNAADLAVEAGFDLIELHAAHGYGLNQWLSPLTNKRSDGYGGSLANRCRILFEIVEGIIARHPRVILSVRMPGLDHMAGGLEAGDTAWIARELEGRGVAVLNISSGIGGWRRPRSKHGEGYLVDDAAMILKNVRIPVIGVGGIKTRAYIDGALNQRLFTLAAVGRAILSDPGWGAQNGLKKNGDSSNGRDIKEELCNEIQ